MSVETDLIEYLETVTAVTTYVSDRIYCDKRDQGDALPAITIHTLFGGEQHHLTGAAGYATPRIQLSVWSANRPEALNIREALRGALQGYSGTWGSTTTIGGVQFESGPFMYEPDETGGDQGTYHQPIDLTIHYQQP